MCLQLNLLNGKNGLCSVPKVFQYHIVGNQFAVEPYGNALANHFDVKCVPFTHFLIGNFDRFALMFLIVVQPSGSYLSAYFHACRIPDLHLRCSAQINSGIRFGTFIKFPVYQHFKIAVLLFCAKVIKSLTIENNQSVFNLPVQSHLLIGFCLCSSQLS